MKELLALYASPAAQAHYDEVVTQLDHALQTAELAIADGAAPPLLAAALFHDVGHLLTGHDDTGATDLRHEDRGAQFLRRFFGPDVTAPVALHVDAKRYLCAIDPAYAATLSDASTASLALQGGPMTAGEAAAFERRQGAADAIRLRRWDDLAKVPGASTRSLDDFVALIES